MLEGGAGQNELRTYDGGDTTHNVGVLTSSTITGLGMTQGIDYRHVQTLFLRLSNGPDDFYVA